MITRILSVVKAVFPIVLMVHLQPVAAEPAAGGGGAGVDLCADVVPVAFGIGDMLTFTGDNSAATTTGDFDPSSPFFEFEPMVTWHAFTTAECMNLTFDYCGM